MSVFLQRVFVVRFKDLDEWQIPRAGLIPAALPKGWIVARVEDFVRQVTDRARVESDKQYKMLGVKWYGKGIFLRETVKGESMSAAWVTPAKPGAFIYNRLFAWKESFAVVPPELSDCFVSGEFPQFTLETSQVSAEYLNLLFRLRSVIRAVNAASAGSAAVSRNRFKEDEFLRMELPLPPLETQRLILAEWHKAQAEIAAAEMRAEQYEQKSISQILHATGITLVSPTKKPKCYFMHLSELDRWGVEFNRWNWRLDNLIVSSIYPSRQLSEIAWVNPLTDNFPRSDELVSFVPMSAVSDQNGDIVERITKPADVVRNGYTRFKEGDIIWAKITPCMQNGKCAVARSLHNGFAAGSTEFHVVRPKDETCILPEYIWILLRLHQIREAAQRYFIGSAGQQRVPDGFLKNLRVPVPPLAVQHQIIQKLETMSARIAHEREAAREAARRIEADLEAWLLGTKEAPHGTR